MPFAYCATSPLGELRQGEILADFYEYRPENPVGNTQSGTPIAVIPVHHPRVVIVSQDCDLLNDYRERVAENHAHRNIVNCLLLCELFEEGDLREQTALNTKEWRQVTQNQNARYHFLPAGGVTDAANPQLPELFLDFKRIVSTRTGDVYKAIEINETKRVAIVPPFFIHDLIQRFYAFHSRIALPQD